MQVLLSLRSAARCPPYGRATPASIVALLLWLLVGVQAAYWGWRVWGNLPPEPQPLPPSSTAAVDIERVARALGAGAFAEPSAAGMALPSTAAGGWRLTGVIAGHNGGGAAVLERDGMPARAYRVGSVLPDGWRVSRIERGAVWLMPAQGTEAIRLSMPTAPR